MTYFAAGAAGVSLATSLYSASSAARGAAKQAGAASRAEGAAIVKERLNASVRASYATALQQMQLANTKRQLSQQSADISAGALAVRGDAELGAAASGSIGASVDAVRSDIDQKVAQAQEATRANYAGAIENYNLELQMQALNMDQSAPTVRKYEYTGPSAGEMFGSAALSATSQFASSYAMRQAKLGLGSSPNVPQLGGSLSLGQGPSSGSLFLSGNF